MIIGQLQGPFDPNTTFFTNELVRFGISIDEKDWWKIESDVEHFPLGFYFMLNGNKIKIDKKLMYETDDFIKVNNFSFPFEVPKSVKIDYIINNDIL